jgi:hypothetical protein
MRGWRSFAVWFGETSFEIARDRNANKGTHLAEESVVVEVAPPQLLYCWTDVSWNSAPATAKSM